MLCSVTIKPKTPVSAIADLIPLLLVSLYRLIVRDMVLVMTVEPGFGGQKFMEDCLEKVSEIRALSPSIYIEVDGGVSVKNAELCASKGANVLVSGSAIFGASDIQAYIAEMKEAVRKHLYDCLLQTPPLYKSIQIIKLISLHLLLHHFTLLQHTSLSIQTTQLAYTSIQRISLVWKIDRLVPISIANSIQQLQITHRQQVLTLTSTVAL